jgi:hypothetical protein
LFINGEVTMQTMQFVARLTVWSLLVPMCMGTAQSLARQTTVTGTAGTVVDIRERSYKHGNGGVSSDEGDNQKIGIRPEVLIVSQDVRDTLSLQYSPTLNYDFVPEDTEVDHQLSLQGERWLSQYWSVSVADNYVRSDDSQAATTGQTNAAGTSVAGGQYNSADRANALSRDLNGQRYWTNTATVRTNYALARDSSVGGGYSYTVLRNEESVAGDEDYDKHAFFTDFSHGFTANWRSSLGLNYTRGLYDEGSPTLAGSSARTPDLDEYGATFGVDYIRSVNDFFPLKYSYGETQYGDDTRPGNQSHQWSAGWDHAFDSRTRLALGAGPSYAKTDGLDGTWGYNAYLTFNKTYEHAAYALSFSKLYETQNFTGTTGDSGLTDTYNAEATFSYQYTEALSFDLFGRYTWQSNLEPQGEYLTSASDGVVTANSTGDVSYDTDTYEAGIGCSYTFARWYKASLRYSYYVSDGDLVGDQYTDHQVLFTLSATKELWRW